ncbi:MAG: GNAT family N-acetyltransferase [Clostridiales bacterium]|nr:GNAT family N-acetyltransferase [Clostridiales bacterium]
MRRIPALETERLLLRPVTEQDLLSIHAILGDAAVMYAWEHGFTEEETRQWIKNRLSGYERDGFSHFAVMLKGTDDLIGLVGPLKEVLDGRTCIGLGWLLRRDRWKQGYAFEAAEAALRYSFEVLGAKTVIADIRPENTASIRLAEKLGMKAQYTVIKHYRGKEMPHTVYAVNNQKTD